MQSILFYYLIKKKLVFLVKSVSRKIKKGFSCEACSSKQNNSHLAKRASRGSLDIIFFLKKSIGAF